MRIARDFYTRNLNAVVTVLWMRTHGNVAEVKKRSRWQTELGHKWSRFRQVMLGSWWLKVRKFSRLASANEHICSALLHYWALTRYLDVCFTSAMEMGNKTQKKCCWCVYFEILTFIYNATIYNIEVLVKTKTQSITVWNNFLCV